LGIDAPEMGRGFDTSAPFGREARDRLTSLVLRRWVRLEYEGQTLDAYNRRLAYVMLEDGVFVNAVLVRGGLARVTARVPLSRRNELKAAEAEAQRFRRGMWGAAPRIEASGYTRRPFSKPRGLKKRRPRRGASWQRFQSSTRPGARFARETSSITDSITGRSGSSSSSSRRVRSRSICSSVASTRAC